MKSFLLCLMLAASLLAHAQPPGTVVAYSPKSSKKYIGSPSIVVLPSGRYVMSHDHFGPGSTEFVRARSFVFASDDRGRSWRQLAELDGQFWSNLFVHNGAVYLMGTLHHYGPLIIRKSTDEGATWTNPVDGKTGLLREGKYHTAPMPMVQANGRLYRAIEWAPGEKKLHSRMFQVSVFSAPENADLLLAESWQQSNLVPADTSLIDGKCKGWLEGNMVQDPQGQLWNVLRTNTRIPGQEYATFFTVSGDGRTVALKPSADIISFEGGTKKFPIRRDAKTGHYYSLVNAIADTLKGGNESDRARNLLVLIRSTDLRRWERVAEILSHPDVKTHAFQYVDFQFDGRDLIVASRTAYDDAEGGAHRAHDANYLTFHRVKNFRRAKRLRVE